MNTKDGVIKNFGIRLAYKKDARQLAIMSKNLIEYGLGWSWIPKRIAEAIQDKDVNVAVACDGSRVLGFAITKYLLNEAHIVLFAVDKSSRRLGIGTALIKWVEETALVAGIGVIYLEARLNNTVARAFYRKLGYQEIKIVHEMYHNIESGVRFAKDLWLNA